MGKQKIRTRLEFICTSCCTRKTTELRMRMTKSCKDVFRFWNTPFVLAETNKRLEICASWILFFNFKGCENSVWNHARTNTHTHTHTHTHIHHELKINVKANKIFPEPSQTTSLRYILMLSYLHLGLSSGLFLSSFPMKCLNTFKACRKDEVKVDPLHTIKAWGERGGGDSSILS